MTILIENKFVSKVGFTLAEVLIVVGIIGIVAAMTIPTLMLNTKKKEIAISCKKFYSNMYQAIKLSEGENGDSRFWAVDYGDPVKFFDTYLAGYFKIIQKYPPKYYFSDGTTLTMDSGQCIDMIFDANGDKKPNILGKDIFIYLFCQNEQANVMFSNRNKTFGVYYEGRTRSSAYTDCKNGNFSCSGLLMYDNWEFKKDYPWW